MLMVQHGTTTIWIRLSSPCETGRRPFLKGRPGYCDSRRPCTENMHRASAAGAAGISWDGKDMEAELEPLTNSIIFQHG